MITYVKENEYSLVNIYVYDGFVYKERWLIDRYCA